VVTPRALPLDPTGIPHVFREALKGPGKKAQGEALGSGRPTITSPEGATQMHRNEDTFFIAERFELEELDTGR